VALALSEFLPSFLFLFGNEVFIPLSAVVVDCMGPFVANALERDRLYAAPELVCDSGHRDCFWHRFQVLMKALVMPLLGADPVNRAFHYLEGNRAAIPGTLYALVIGSGFGEETLFRGYMLERLGKLLGNGSSAKILIVLITSILFGLAHYPVQGLTGTEQATAIGLEATARQLPHSDQRSSA
jgi:membrane protease YdiL (CAAX protease family)